jgi:hypothetical protein
VLYRLLATAALTALAFGLLPVPAGAAEVIQTPPTVTAITGGARSVGQTTTETTAPDQVPASAAPPGAAADTAVLSQPVSAPIPFSMVGFEVPPGTRGVDFRTSVDGQSWEPWTTVELPDAEGGPDAGTPEAAQQRENFTEPVWVREARWLQTRVAGADTTEVDAHLIDSAGLSRGPVERVADALSAAWHGGAPKAQAADAPDIVTRKEWGADESLRRDDPSVADDVELGIVHHTAGTNSYAQSESAGIVRGIYSYHVQSRGWNDVGYNFLVDRYGTIFEGRYGGIKKAVIGAHAAGFNEGSVGFSVMGEFSSGAPTAEAREALAQLIAWKFKKHKIDPADTVEVTSAGEGTSRHAAGEKVSLRTISGHRDVGQTACPGGAFYAALDDLRARVTQLMDDGGKGKDGDAQPLQPGQGLPAPAPAARL